MDRALLSAIASPRRREILRLLWHGERSVGDIHGAMSDVTMGAISLQLKTLTAVGLVQARADRQQRIYRVCRQRAEPVAQSSPRSRVPVGSATTSVSANGCQYGPRLVPHLS